MTDREINKIRNNKKVTHCYIRKGNYYRPNHCGYTDSITKAGIYPKEDAIRSAESCRELDLIPIDIQQHNQHIMDDVRDLLTRYINLPKP